MSHKKRAARRGAAMIEGVVVVSTMLVFLGTIQFARQSYGKKLDVQQTTRANTAYHAAHGCTDETKGGNSTAVGSGEGGTEAERVANKTALNDRAAASKDWNNTYAKANEEVAWSAVWQDNPNSGVNPTKHTGTRNISGASQSSCNEKKYNSQWTAWLQFGIDFATTGGGVKDLFN